MLESRDGLDALAKRLRELSAGESSGRTALVEALREQLPVIFSRAMEEHDGVYWVEVTRIWTTDKDGVETEVDLCGISASSSCKCRMMSSDPDFNELLEHEEEIKVRAYRVLSALPAGLLSDLFGRVAKIRFYPGAGTTGARCATPPFPAEDDGFG